MNILKNLKKINITGATEILTSTHNTLLHNVYLIQKAIDNKESWTEGFELNIGEEDHVVELSITNSYPSERNYLAGVVTLQDGSEVRNASAKFPWLRITCSNDDYIEFKDPEVRRILFEKITNDGLGIKESQAKSVTSIQSNGTIWFYNNKNITSFNELPKLGLTTLRQQDFDGCSNLRSIDLNNITEISHRCFRNNTNLRNITNAHNVKTLGEEAFVYSGIEDVNFPSLVTIQSYNTFGRCSNLKNVYSLGNITAIPQSTFDYCTNLESVVLPTTIDLINHYAFRGCTKLNSINFSDLQSLKTIGAYAFEGCNNTSIDLNSANITELREAAFSASGVTSINLPNLNVLNYQAFTNNKKLQSVVNLGNIVTIPNETFRGCNNLQQITIPSTVTAIGTYAFDGCTNITTLENIENCDIQQVDYGAFNGCSNLHINLNFNNLSNISENAFHSTGIIDDIDLPNLQNLGQNAFFLSKLKKITNLGKYTGYDRDGNRIGRAQFQNCANLTDVILNENQKNLGDAMFSGCSKLENVVYDKESIKDIGAECFYRCSELNIDLDFPNLQTLGYGAFLYCRLKKILNLGQISTIGRQTFDQNVVLTEAVLPETITNIDHYAFRYCSKLEKVDFSGMNATLGVECFNGCGNLNNILNYHNLISLSDNCFSSTSITEIVSENISSIGRQCFSRCSKLSTVYLPNINAIPPYAFQFIPVTELKFNDKLTTVDMYGFEGSYLKTLVINSTSVPSLNGSFVGVTLQNIYVPDSVINDYKTANNWSMYADIIKPISSYTGDL